MTTSGSDPTSQVIEPTKEIIRIIETDHAATTELISRLTTLRVGLRGLVITLGSSLLGIALTQRNWIIAAVGIPIVVAGAFTEARTDFLVRLAHNRSVRLEHRIQAYVSHLIEKGAVGEDAKRKFQREIDTYQFGISRSLRGPSIWKALGDSVKGAPFWLYAAFAAALLAVALLTGLITSPSQPNSVGCIKSSTGGVIELRELPTIRTGELMLVECPRTSAVPTTQAPR